MVGGNPQQTPAAEAVTLAVAPSIRNRAFCLRKEAERLLRHHYATSAPERLLRFVMASAVRVADELDELVQTETRETLTREEFDQSVIRYSHLLIILHKVMSVVDRVQIEETPGELTAPLRRLISSLVPDSDLILQAGWDVNYTVLDVRRWVEESFGTADPDLLTLLPSSPLLIQFPKAEFGNVLLYPILAHELGHQIYRYHGMADTLLPSIRLDQPRISAPHI